MTDQTDHPVPAYSIIRRLEINHLRKYNNMYLRNVSCLCSYLIVLLAASSIFMISFPYLLNWTALDTLKIQHDEHLWTPRRCQKGADGSHGRARSGFEEEEGYRIHFSMSNHHIVCRCFRWLTIRLLLR